MKEPKKDHKLDELIKTVFRLDAKREKLRTQVQRPDYLDAVIVIRKEPEDDKR